MSNDYKSLTSQTNTKLNDSINFNTATDANKNYSNEDLNESNQEYDYNEYENNNSQNEESETLTFLDTKSTKIVETTTSVAIKKSSQQYTSSSISKLSEDNINRNGNNLPHLIDNLTHINFSATTSTNTEINKLANINNSTQVF
jgi:hypothetical protein